ncbi:HEAT repeat domain-containing protein [Blastococcus goldschmidtiae]|uniref:HEAT repeat domain-containing protein n=1 Tax=Blastococcus goldschmidtiae TaxID=3075546 RepID=A0ABU2KDR1_9ACTN|nr:HEAT repeat domain-containing protein [Blastococcus sp. DSM 46792]MDT0278330.1 HEAT repeat domain-containing protein [Blastococcus sp. DSM 46792]
MTDLPGPLLLTSTGVTGLVVLLLLSVGGAHVARRRGERRDAARRAELTPLVYTLLDGEQTAEALADAPAVLDDVVLHLLPQLRGSDRQVLRDLLVARGVVDRASEQLSARAPWRRGRAAMLLGATGSTRHTPDLVTLLEDRSPDVRSAATRALGKTGDVAAVPDLLAALTTGRAVPSGIVGMALLDLGTPALPALRTALDSGTAPARALSASLLGLHGDLPATAALTAALDDAGAPAEVRLAAAGALGRIGAPQATGALARVTVLAVEPALRAAAAEALGRIGDPDSVPALAAGMSAADLRVRTACADALASITPEGRDRLRALGALDGPAAPAARAALDAAPLGSARPLAGAR